MAKMGTKKKNKENKLNALALNRRSSYCMKPIVADKGYVFVATDCGSAEPTILLNYTDDKTLYSILYNMRGVTPYWENGILMTDSLYITTLSSTPLLLPELTKRGVEFIDTWTKDSDEAKDSLGKYYKSAKAKCLGMLYGMQYKKLGRELADDGFVFTDLQCKAIVTNFWNSMPACRDFRDYIIYEFNKANKAERPYISPFGVILPTSKPKDAMNYMIQSAVSAWMRRFELEIKTITWFWISISIHDEFIFEIPKDRLAEAKEIIMAAAERVNKIFGLTYPILLGWKVANNFAGIKGVE